MKKLYYNIKFWYKLKFNKPIYRVDILRAVKYNYGNHRKTGLCSSIYFIGLAYDFNFAEFDNTSHIFPKLKYNYAEKFNTKRDNSYWWTRNDWIGGRMKFLNWLISEYKNDKEDLRYFKYE